MCISTSYRMQVSSFSVQIFLGYAFVPLNGFHTKCPCYIKIPRIFKTYGGVPPHRLDPTSNTKSSGISGGQDRGNKFTIHRCKTLNCKHESYESRFPTWEFLEQLVKWMMQQNVSSKNALRDDWLGFFWS